NSNRPSSSTSCWNTGGSWPSTPDTTSPCRRRWPPTSTTCCSTARTKRRYSGWTRPRCAPSKATEAASPLRSPPGAQPGRCLGPAGRSAPPAPVSRAWRASAPGALPPQQCHTDRCRPGEQIRRPLAGRLLGSGAEAGMGARPLGTAPHVVGAAPGVLGDAAGIVHGILSPAPGVIGGVPGRAAGLVGSLLSAAPHVLARAERLDPEGSGHVIARALPEQKLAHLGGELGAQPQHADRTGGVGGLFDGGTHLGLGQAGQSGADLFHEQPQAQGRIGELAGAGRPFGDHLRRQAPHVLV